MKKIYFLASLAVLALASCSNDELEDGAQSAQGTAIGFGTSSTVMTRAAGLEDATSGLGSTATFKVFGTKTVSGASQNVFPNYTVSYNTTNNTDVTNVANWTYLATNQTVKFWDYAASEYDFYAAAPATIAADGINATSWTLTVPSTGNWFVTNKTPITSTIGNTVNLTFRNGMAKLKLGIYETVPGYSIKSVTFYVGTESKTNATLAGTIKNATKYTVTYDTDGKAILTPSEYGTDGSSVDFGTFTLATTQKVNTADDAQCLGVSSTAPTFAATIPTVMPVTSTDAAPLTLKVNYTLYSVDTDETINVTGATAVVPAAYTAWQANYQYTYLFKISDNTNGYTGTDASKAGLYPITFDAVIEDSQSGAQGTITTVSTPSITTYQDGSVTSTGIEYAAAKAIDVTITSGASQVTPAAGSIKVYSLGTTAKTEADCQLSANLGSEVSGAVSISGNVATIAAGKLTATNYYAIQYLVSAAVKYTASDAEVTAGTKTTNDIKTPAVYAYKVIYIAK